VLLRVFANADEARRMGKHGRKLIERNYNWTVVTDRILDLYEDAIE
jgi:glycosyltransferase involved in cell wall biosynthesis